MTNDAISSKLDRMIGHLDAIRTELGEQGECLNNLRERMAVVEKGVSDTKDVVDAWTATKVGLRWVKWTAIIGGALLSFYFTLKAGLHK